MAAPKSPDRNDAGAGPAAWIVRRRAVLALAWILATVALLPPALSLPERLTARSRLVDSESVRVDRLLAGFGGRAARTSWLVVTGVEAMDRAPGRAALAEIVARLRAHPTVAGVTSYLETRNPLFLGAAGSGAVVFVELAEGPGPDALVRGLRAAAAGIGEALRPRFPALELHWTGGIALDTDLIAASEADARAGELRALPLSFVLLVLAFGALGAALCPVVLAGLAIVLALGAAGALVGTWQPSVLLQNIVSLLGLALGIDYSLLIVSRYRELRAAGRAPEAAAAETLRRAGRAVVVSGGAVAVGFVALLAVPIDELRSVALGGLLIAAAAVLLATTLLPAWLIWFDRWLDCGRLPVRRRRAAGALWHRWGLWVAARPWPVLLCAGALVGLLAVPVKDLKLALPIEGWLPRGMESLRGLEALEGIGRAGVIYRHLLVLELPEGTRALDPAGWRALGAVHRRLLDDPRVAAVVSLPGLVGPGLPPGALAMFVPPGVRDRFVGPTGRHALYEVIPREDVAGADLFAMARDLRAFDAATVAGTDGGRVLVGGLVAATLDYRDVVVRWFPAVIALVVIGAFVVLAVGFRSVVIPFKAVLLNLLPVAAACGALVLVFMHGVGAGLFGVTGALSGIFPAIPIIVFCTVYGISMDYEVFLVARVAESHRAGAGDAAAVAEGLGRTGGVITSAAAVMIAVFGAFALGDFLPVQMLGFALAVAVLLDAAVVRVALGPALIKLAGRWNWWPERRAESPVRRRE